MGISAGLRTTAFTTLLAALMVTGCECGDERTGGGTRPARDSGIVSFDGGEDGGQKPEAGMFFDAGFGIDAGQIADSGASDASTPLDAGGMLDAGQPADAAALDAGEPADSGGSSDTGVAPDSGVAADTGVPLDSGVPPDTGVPPDSGVPADSGVAPDSGVVPGSGDLWIEIRYAGAYSARSPRWSYSSSPGWGAIDWDFRGSRGGGAEVWDLRNNSQIVDDHVGRAAVFQGELQLMLGLTRLISHSGVTVEMEGRSYACCSPVRFDVFNPATGCGVSQVSMSQSWTPSMVSLDLSGCFVNGSNLQAVRIDPTSGTVALTRMRVTFHNARW